MHEALVEALINRLEHQESKEDLRAEVIAAGYSATEFEAAFAEAGRRFADTNTPSVPDETTRPHTPPPPATNATPDWQRASRARGELHTLSMQPPKPPGLIGYSDLLRAGWQIGNEALGVIGGFLGAIVLLIPIIILMAVALGGATLLFDIEDNTATQVSFVLVIVVMYFSVIFYGAMAGLAVFRGFVKRNDEAGPVFWPHFWWSWQHLVSFFLVSFYIQVVMNAGFVMLVIPGIMASVYLSFALYALADRGVRGFDALIDSFELVYGYFWEVLFRRIFLFMVAVVAFMVSILMMALQPLIGFALLLLAIAGVYYIFASNLALYESLRALPRQHEFAPEERRSIKMWLRILIVAAVLFWLGSFISTFNSFDPDPENPDKLDQLFQEFLGAEMPTTDELPETTNDRRIPGGEAFIKSELLSAQARAELYRRNNADSYAGVCSNETGINTNMRYAYDAGSDDVFCRDDEVGYIAEAEILDTGKYFCIDSEGNALEQTVSRNGYATCIDEPNFPDDDRIDPANDGLLENEFEVETETSGQGTGE